MERQTVKPGVVYGHVTTLHGISDGKTYATVKFRSKNNVNFRIFLEGTDFELGQKVKMTVEPLPKPQPQPQPQPAV